jgi:hypothetical protein
MSLVPRGWLPALYTFMPSFFFFIMYLYTHKPGLGVVGGCLYGHPVWPLYLGRWRSLIGGQLYGSKTKMWY